MKSYRTIFIGTPEYSVPTLQALIADERFDVVAVITAPDAKVGRKQAVTPPPVKVAAQKHSIEILQPVTLSGRDEALPRLYDTLRTLRPDVIVTIAYGQIIPKEILDLPPYGCLNLHASLLPKYRGASPIQAAIKNGDEQTGVTLMKMNEGLDTGPVIGMEKIPVAPADTGETLHDKLAVLSAQTLIKYLPEYLAGNLKPIPQDDAQTSIVPKITRADGRIDWNKPAVEIERLVRAYYPWPGTWTMCNDKMLKIITVNPEVLNINKHKPGEVFMHEEKLAVQCGTDTLILNTLQLQGKKSMAAKQFARGYKAIIDTILK